MALDGVQVTAWPGLRRLTTPFLEQLHAAAEERGWVLDDLLGQLWYESGFRADAASPHSTARGLAQMINATARATAGVSSATLATWPDVKQLPAILKLYGDRPLSGADFRLIGYGASPSVADEHIVSTRGDINPGAADADGNITGASIRREWRERIAAKRPGFGTVSLPLPNQGEGAANQGRGSLVLFAVLGAGGYYLWRRNRNG